MSLPQPFAYQIEPHLRKHAPAGYADYTDYKPWLRDEFEFRCVYCLQRETWSREGAAAFSVDHIFPQTFDPVGAFACEYSNLLYACNRCNSARQDALVLDPTHEGMGEHLRVHADGTISGLTFDGLVLIQLLHLNSAPVIKQRRQILDVLILHVRYPGDPEVMRLYHEVFGYPDDLPDLRRKRPPEGNALPENAENCCFARREQNQLPLTYSHGECPRFYEG